VKKKYGQIDTSLSQHYRETEIPQSYCVQCADDECVENVD